MIRHQIFLNHHKTENDEKFVILCLQSIIHYHKHLVARFFVARGIFTSNYSYNLPCSGNNHVKSYNSHNSLRQYDFQFTDFQQLLQLMFNGIRNSQRSFRQFFSIKGSNIFNHFIMLFYYFSSSYLYSLRCLKSKQIFYQLF